MEIIQKTNKDLSIRQAYLQDCIHREMERIEEIISNASESCYKSVLSFLSLFVAGYGVLLGSFVSSCCFAEKPHAAIIIISFATILLIILFFAINHYKLYKRQSVFRNVLKSLEMLYENVACNYLSAEQALNGSNIVDYSMCLKKLSYKKWLSKDKICPLVKELLHLIICALLTIVTAVLIICL